MPDIPAGFGPVPPAGRAGPADRLSGLIDAHTAITADTDLPLMLERIVRAACRLVGARYGVLGVRGDDGVLAHSVRHGRLIGTAAEQLVLEVAIEVSGTVFGTLFLAGPDAGEFNAEDEEFAGALASVAGTAVMHARLFAEARRAGEWLMASGDIARGLLLADDVEILPLVVERAMQVATADYGTLIIATPDGRLQALYPVGVGADEFRGLVFDPDESPIGRAVVAGRSALIDDMTTNARAGFVNRWNYGAALLVPLIDPAGTRGAILLIRNSGREPFTDRDAEMGGIFAAQVALALELDEARLQREQLRALEVRHRIAKDLHDNVIQRLFAIGVGLEGLQNAAGAQLGPDVRARLSAHVQALDETIEQIRTQVFNLREGDDGSTSPSAFPRIALPDTRDVTSTHNPNYTD